MQAFILIQESFMRPAPTQPSWFDLKKYRRSRTLQFRDWANQIGSRIHLQSLLVLENFDEFDLCFETLAADPFADLGFRVSLSSDKTVCPLTFGVAKTFTDILSDAKCAVKDICDEELRKLHPEIYSGQAHLYVDLRAPKALVIKQFITWFEASHIKRERNSALSESVIQSWAVTHPILPYQDLRLWFLRHKGKMPTDGAMANARWFLSPVDKDGIKAIRKWANRAFTLKSYHDLLQSAENAQST